MNNSLRYGLDGGEVHESIAYSHDKVEDDVVFIILSSQLRQEETELAFQEDASRRLVIGSATQLRKEP